MNRTTSTYYNTLTVNGTIEDVIGEYSCTVVNSLGSSNTLTKTIKGTEMPYYGTKEYNFALQEFTSYESTKIILEPFISAP